MKLSLDFFLGNRIARMSDEKLIDRGRPFFELIFSRFLFTDLFLERRDFLFIVCEYLSKEVEMLRIGLKLTAKLFRRYNVFILV